jgi:hypothetical protein
MMSTDTDIIALLEQATAELRLRPPPRNWIAAFRDGRGLRRGV